MASRWACDRRSSVNCMPVSSTRFQSGGWGIGTSFDRGATVGRGDRTQCVGVRVEVPASSLGAACDALPDLQRPAASRSGTSRARSAATNGGGGSGTGSPPTLPRHARQHERERPAERGRERAVGRRTIADHHARGRRTASARARPSAPRACPRPRASRPAAVDTAAASAPAPGTTPPSIGYVGSRLVATNRAPPRAASAARVSPSKSKSRWKPTTTASTGPLESTTRRPWSLERLDHARARAREHRRAGAAPATRRARPRPARSCTRRRDRPGCRTRASRCT